MRRGGHATTTADVVSNCKWGERERESASFSSSLSLSDNANEQVGVRSSSCGEQTIHSLLLSIVRVPTKGYRLAAKGELLITLM